MSMVRPARPADAAAIGAVHVAAWRSAYAGILPDGYLSRLSAVHHAAWYDTAIRKSGGVFVAVAGAPPRVVGFTTAGRARSPLADGEIETLYVLDDWREHGFGRLLMRAGARHLQAAGCRSAFLWVLRENPSRWFYQRLGGRPAAESTTHVAGTEVPQLAYLWDPIERLLEATARAE